MGFRRAIEKRLRLKGFVLSLTTVVASQWGCVQSANTSEDVCILDSECGADQVCLQGDCVATECGDGRVDPVEECDAGEANGDSAGCTNDCVLNVCGDGKLLAGTEQCDDGNLLTEVCDYGPTPCQVCDDQCANVAGAQAFCGDAEVNGPESCDDGVNDGAYDGCLATCELAERCGDNIINGPEVCDGADYCLSDCSGFSGFCGDGIVDAVEECDDGTSSNNGTYGGCNNDCTKAAFCGDLEVNGSEACDGSATCSDDCLGVCGDGTQQAGEECDDGVNTTVYGDGCGTACTLPRFCGDGVIDAVDGEECDDGNEDTDDACDTECLALCAAIPPADVGLGYVPPVAGTVVSSISALENEILNGFADDIILADGLYSRSSHLNLNRPVRLWAQNLLGAELDFGIEAGNVARSGSEFHGLKFDIDDIDRATFLSAYTNPSSGAAILWWTGARDVVVEDCVIDGNGVIKHGILSSEPEGAIVRRVEVHNVRQNGVRVSNPNLDPTLENPVVIEDIVVTNVGENLSGPGGDDYYPGELFGTTEACIWLGHEGSVKRVNVQNCFWNGVWLGNAIRNFEIEDMVTNYGRIGLGHEKYTDGGQHKRLCIGDHTTYGVSCEFGGPDGFGGFLSGCSNNVFEDSLIEATVYGINFDSYHINNRVENVVFRNAIWGGVGYSNSPTTQLINNRYSLPEGVANERPEHLNLSECGPGCDPECAIELPTPPQSYTLPDVDVVMVTDAAELQTAMAGTDPKDIILDDGVYDPADLSAADYIQFTTPHRLWAKTLGAAEVKFGFYVVGNADSAGAEFHGILFDLDSRDNEAIAGAVITNWANGGNLKIEDCVFDGGAPGGAGFIPTAIQGSQMDGMVINRVVFRNFRDFGINGNQNSPSTVVTPPEIHNVDMQDIHFVTSGASAGSQEIGILLRTPANVSNIRMRAIGSTGILLEDGANNGTMSMVDIDDVAWSDGQAVRTNVTSIPVNTYALSNFCVGDDVTNGFVFEANSAIDITVDNFEVEAADVGFFVGAGNTGVWADEMTCSNAVTACFDIYDYPANGFTNAIYNRLWTVASWPFRFDGVVRVP